jgi:hypothetical protein
MVHRSTEKPGILKKGVMSMSKNLVIDSNNRAWHPAYLSVIKGEQPVCPYCGKPLTDISPVDLGERVGYLTITCNDCNKTGYFSRVTFPKGVKTISGLTMVEGEVDV